MQKKIIAMILAALQTAAFFSCADKGSSGTPTETGGNETETTAELDYIETLPKKNYDGYKFRVIAQSYDQRPNLPLFEEENGETLNDAIIRRNRLVEELYNIEIVNLPYDDRGEVTNLVKNTVMADEDAYDLIINSINFGINTLTADGCLYDLSQLKYLQLDKDWWCKSIYDDFQVNGHLYFTSGTLSPFYYYMPAAVAYNKTLTDESNITGLEQLVIDGKWTLDKLKELTKGGSADINGDSAMDAQDKWAIVASPNDGYLTAGLGERMIIRSGGDGFKLNMDSENFIKRLQAAAAYYSDNSTLFITTDTSVFLSMFQADRAMFMPTSMNNIITGYNDVPSCREMKSDYGILPLPKFDENQETYYTCGQPAGPSGIAVPATNRDTERTSLIMEAMAYYSNSLIREAAYEYIIKGKATRVDDTDKMLDIVYDSIYFDMNHIFNFGNSKDAINTALTNNAETYMSDYAVKKPAAEEALNKYVSMLKELE